MTVDHPARDRADVLGEPWDSPEVRVFVEHAPGTPEARHYPLDGTTAHRVSSFQVIESFRVPQVGAVLALDGVVQVADIDAYVYHEILTHPALCAHPDPRVVAIAGGGDGHTVREVLKHRDVEAVYLLERDPEVTEAAAERFPGVSEALADPRVHVRTGDALRTLAETPRRPDVIICDMTDPVGQAARFFSAEFYRLAADVLSPSGIVVSQAESLHYHPAVVRDCLRFARDSFPHTGLLHGAMATYPGGWWAFVIASKGGDPRRAVRRPALPTRLYRASAHSWFFVPDEVAASLLALRA